MSLQRTRLTELIQVSNSIGAVYTNPASTTSYVRGFIVTNTDTLIRTVRIDWVPDTSGSVGTPATGTKLFPEIQLDPNETFVVDLPYAIVMKDTNETIQAVSDAANKVNIAVFGDLDA